MIWFISDEHFYHSNIIGKEGHCLWCYECGAIRINYEKWIKPVGKGGENPCLST